jgi:hypothetical protein
VSTTQTPEATLLPAAPNYIEKAAASGRTLMGCFSLRLG